MGSLPLVSCVMPTYGRPVFALQAVRYFLRQDYPARELLILDDGPEGLAASLPDDQRLRYVRLPRLPIGGKRNIGCALARGTIIAQWDDDDWYGPGRLSVQVAPLLAGQADITGIRGTMVFDLERWQAWTCTPRLHRLMYRHDVHGGTLVYFRHLWESRACYPNRSLAEDARFLSRLVRSGARLAPIQEAGQFVYIRHGANTWSFRSGRFLDPRGWRCVPGVPLPAEDRPFYVALAAARAEDIAARRTARRTMGAGPRFFREAISRMMAAEPDRG
ncbi:MAG TPA: glycosyltransferase family 2 protein [Acetobacteraceae bacterium]|nr:glycosyltransferase family 2 protein [Acetobacteraceae bacterium]